MSVSVLLAVDPGSSCTGWAWYLRLAGVWTLSALGHITRPTPDQLLAMIEEQMPAIGSGANLVIEGQWLGKRSQGAIPHESVVALALQRRDWQLVWWRLTGDTGEVIPATWLGQVAGKSVPEAPWMTKSTSRDTERRLATVAEVVCPGLGRRHKEEFSAAMLGRYRLMAWGASPVLDLEVVG